MLCACGNTEGSSISSADVTTSSTVCSTTASSNIISEITTVTTAATSVFTEISSTFEKPQYAQVSHSTVDLTAISSDYLKNMIIIGDSIAKGFGSYSKISVNQVLAEGSVAARNINDFNFSYRGVQMSLKNALEKAKPKYIFMSMGMNDISITSKEIFCNNYIKNISDIAAICPEAKIIVVSITPVSATVSYINNSKIDEYNLALSQMIVNLNNPNVFYANTAQTIKNAKGALEPSYSSGDGIHLAPVAYDYILSYMISMLDWIR